MPLPPGPRLPRFAQTALWIARPLEFLERCERDYGDAFTIRLSESIGTFACFSSPEAVRQILTADDVTLLGGVAADFLRPMVGSYSLLLLDGPPHHRQRKLLVPPLHGERMQAYAEAMREVAEASLDAWPVGSPFAIHAPMQDITLAVILRTVFGMDEGPRMRELSDALTDLTTIGQSPLALLPQARRDLGPLTPWRRFLEARARVDALLFAEIARRRAAHRPGARADVLSLLLDARDEDGGAMTDQELRDELITMLIAGHETSATTLAWVFDRLLARPDVVARCDEELARVVGDAPLRADHVPALEYLEGVVRETLRLRPILPMVGRMVAKPVEIGAVLLEPGVLAMASVYLTHRRAESYPDPLAYRPERWLGVRPDPYRWLPFGGGARRCIGMAFAMYEMKIVLAAVLLRARLRLADARPARVVRRGITLAPSGGTRVVVTSRRPRRAPSSSSSPKGSHAGVATG